MGKILVLYDSQTGNTKKMAEFVAEGARENPHHEVRLRSVDDAKMEDIVWCDGLALGTPTQLGLISWKMKRFWDEMEELLWGKIDGKIGCSFSSSGGWGGGSEISCLSALIMLINYGFLVFGVTDYVEDKFTLHYGAVAAGEPRLEREIKACRRLGERLSQWVEMHTKTETLSTMEEDY
ncbi:MAG TPA: flavodoxin domain-containing protein [Ignavibacteriales bacterium]|nr:flavodoxin domain-containing protein [Ignavibacteriales bacterium]